jgi:membrane associated rhomboid family serine protease
VRHIRRHSPTAGLLPVARRVAGFRSFLLWSTARAGGVTYVGLFGTWLPLPGWTSLSLPLPGQPEHDFYAISALQVAVFLAWRLPDCIPFLSRHFLLSSERHTLRRPWTLLGACFSHMQPMHLLHNTVTLLQSGPVLQLVLGRAHFLAFYLLTGAAANVGSLLLRRLQRPSQRRDVSSLGASGALYGVAAALAVLQPGRQFSWWPAFWAPEVRLNAVQMLLANLALDHFSRGRHGIDTAAHLCGAAAGALWMMAIRLL